MDLTRFTDHNTLLGSSRMQRLMMGFPGRFDLLIIDTPPVLGAAEASAIAARASGVLMVIRAARTERGAARQAVQQLAGVGAHIVGAVLNDPDAQAPRFGEYYYAFEYSERPS